MSLNSILNIGVSGLMTSQDQLRVVSDNISNVNTPGYVRKVSHQSSVNVGGVGMGVTSGQVTLSADRYLQQASLKASSASSQSDINYELLDQIQAQFGDITDTNNLFNQGAAALTNAAQAAEDPTSNAGRQQVLSAMSSFVSEGARISDKIQTIRGDADSRIASGVNAVNDLLKSISDLNSTISGAHVSGQDATGAQTTQMQYIDQLSKLVDVAVSQNENGGVTVRTQNGMMLAGDSYVTLSYQPQTKVDATTSFNPIVVTGVNGEKRDLADNISSGEIKGLMDLRDKGAVAVNDQLNQYMARFADAVNAAHNDATAVPPPASLTGKNTSLTQAEATAGFTGQTNLVTVDASGKMTHQMTVDFDANTYSLDGGAATAFDPANMASDLTAGFGGAATLSFNNGALSFASNTSGTGVAVVNPATGGASKLGQGFSQYFGLNDLITSDVPTRPQTGLNASSDHGFTAGSAIGFALKSSNGATLANVNFTVPSGGSMTDMVNALNDTATGVGRYGTFSLDTSGQLTFQGFGNPANSLSVTSDPTKRNGTGASFSSFFGLAGNQSNVAGHLAVNQVVYNDPSKLSLAKVNLNAAAGQANLLPGDGSGGQELAGAGTRALTFAKTALNSGGTSTLERYGSDLAGQVGNLAANAKTMKESNGSLLTEASSRRNAYEGVNLDEELVNLTTYQQGYSAAGRLIQAAKDMYDVLLNMI